MPQIASAESYTPKPTRLHLALNPDELGQDPLPGLRLANHLGLDGVEIRTCFGVNALLLPDHRVRELHHMVRDHGLVVAALASPLFKWSEGEVSGGVDSFGFPTSVPRVLREGHIKRAMEVARILEAKVVRVFSNLAEKPGGIPFQEDPLLLFTLRLAREAGVVVAVENEPVCTVCKSGDLLALLSCHGGHGLGLWLDVANLFEVGNASMETLAALAPFVRYVHVKDYAGTAAGKRFCPAGSGDVPYSALLPALFRQCPDVWYTLETHVRDDPTAALQEGTQYLRRLEAVP